MTSDLKRALEHLRLRAAVRRSCATLAGWLAHGAGLSLVLMMLHVTLDVLLKYFFKLPIPGTAEVVAAYYMIGVVFLPLAYIEVHGRPIMVELFYDRLPQRLQAPLDMLGSALSLGFYAFLAWQSTKMACAALESGEYIDGLWQVVVWPSRFLIPSGLLLACAAMLLRLAVLLQGGRAGHGGDCAEPL
ncbi:TRAP transporter small permease subunit [Verminephrobacter eiseniae]|uniref:TRAP transporter small permease subunit n=1 Tax=Verminephrobacter eiseniae TaxID=364317 RepID=UPI002237D879|nr:TRAP transporter small permease [Verminephrobacter eiseniae]MCW5229989.1 TRAP transporter small permease [Verminephrobacter eiseniae]MCW5291721.1 TRAP transporter small permease [Verminephrobacter eiseniae]MCW8183390.1 TRAP transporter small permease [Verminephrobacter eiseniae]MCW8221657.1 TRAP transporter small permease [Verminephrobacter eiseniae]MCW8233493.1 TRAP transporter small permease [Verminephrobacter eiseniae]